MTLEILARNRYTGECRRIRKKYSVRDMRKIESLLRKIRPEEAVIEVRLDDEPLL